jgi:hypothetical protein
MSSMGKGACARCGSPTRRPVCARCMFDAASSTPPEVVAQLIEEAEVAEIERGRREDERRRYTVRRTWGRGVSVVIVAQAWSGGPRERWDE